MLTGCTWRQRQKGGKELTWSLVLLEPLHHISIAVSPCQLGSVGSGVLAHVRPVFPFLGMNSVTAAFGIHLSSVLKAICSIPSSPGEAESSFHLQNTESTGYSSLPCAPSFLCVELVALRERKTRKPQAGVSGAAKGRWWKRSSQEINPAKP